MVELQKPISMEELKWENPDLYDQIIAESLDNDQIDPELECDD